MKRKSLIILVTLISPMLAGQALNPDKPEKGIWDLQMRKIWKTDTAGKDIFGAIQEIDVTHDGKSLVMPLIFMKFS